MSKQKEIFFSKKNKKKRLSKKKGVKVEIEKWAEKRKAAQKKRAEKEKKRPPKFKRDVALHKQYLERYKRRVQKQLREYAPLLYLNKADEVSDGGDK